MVFGFIQLAKLKPNKPQNDLACLYDSLKGEGLQLHCYNYPLEFWIPLDTSMDCMSPTCALYRNRECVHL